MSNRINSRSMLNIHLSFFVMATAPMSKADLDLCFENCRNASRNYLLFSASKNTK